MIFKLKEMKKNIQKKSFLTYSNILIKFIYSMFIYVYVISMFFNI